ncbi:hypothetical protein [Microbacterium sp. H1-D42]|uniref:hypothetical protein n=1 Tax=Microbacterium sp. H1-D42 TaxID=2925844 RepID=UPI001F52C756|nr:hypothetical protein [Microbacterium sp. H1-D42]UNK71232.1 hypothetical protein MNR00_01920 [Microbacterium sp. H1-D42]
MNARASTAVGVVLLVAGALAGCAVTPADAYEAVLAARAQADAADFARDLYRGPTDTIDDYARWADEKLATHPSVELIGYEAYSGAVHGEPFGALQVRVMLGGQVDPYTACFESKFDYWGVATEEFGDWEDDDAVALPVDCTSDAKPIPPPVDTRPVPVVPDGTEAVVVEVLGTAAPDASPADIVAAVKARMPEPTGDREVAFDPSAVVSEQQIGFAMGDVDDCLLVTRRASGEVEVLSVPRVLLQPGELGCRAETALLPADRLRSPH